MRFLSDLGCKIAAVSNEDREVVYLFQRLPICLQRFNAVLLHDSLPESDALDLWSVDFNFFFSLVFLSLGNLYYAGRRALKNYNNSSNILAHTVPV